MILNVRVFRVKVHIKWILCQCSVSNCIKDIRCCEVSVHVGRCVCLPCARWLSVGQSLMNQNNLAVKWLKHAKTFQKDLSFFFPIGPRGSALFMVPPLQGIVVIEGGARANGHGAPVSSRRGCTATCRGSNSCVWPGTQWPVFQSEDNKSGPCFAAGSFQLFYLCFPILCSTLRAV